MMQQARRDRRPTDAPRGSSRRRVRLQASQRRARDAYDEGQDETLGTDDDIRFVHHDDAP